MTHQEEKLEEIFRDLDRDKDGRIDLYDLQLYSDKLGNRRNRKFLTQFFKI